MPNSIEIAERVLAPGNLVFGCNITNIRSLLEQGIRPASVVGKDSLATPDNLCFALLSDHPLPERYQGALHYAPGGILGGHTLGIIVAREELLKIFPGQVFAIGAFFWERIRAHRLHYQYKPCEKTVFDIPIKVPNTNFVFSDEVRVYPRDIRQAAVQPSRWTGLIMEKFHYQHLKMFLKGCELPKGVPILSDKCALLNE